MIWPTFHWGKKSILPGIVFYGMEWGWFSIGGWRRSKLPLPSPKASKSLKQLLEEPCVHERLATDNVVTWCTTPGCDEQWSAVTLTEWPSGCRCLYFGNPERPNCAFCGKVFAQIAHGYWCRNCDRSDDRP